MSKYLLFIDETGMGDPKTYNRSPYYILVGCVVKVGSQDKLRDLANQIKYKYWNRTNIVFHSVDIGMKKNEFTILEDDQTNKQFLKDIKKLLSHSAAKYIYAVVDKQQAKNNGWQSHTVYKRSSKAIIETFLAILAAKGARGEMVCEYSTAEKDIKLYEAFAHLLARGRGELKITHDEAKERLTSIKFATKKNYDTETQLCDLFGHIAKYHQLKKDQKLTKGYDYFYEEYMLPVFLRSMFATPQSSKKRKANIYKKIKSYILMP